MAEIQLIGSSGSDSGEVDQFQLSLLTCQPEFDDPGVVPVAPDGDHARVRVEPQRHAHVAHHVQVLGQQRALVRLAQVPETNAICLDWLSKVTFSRQGITCKLVWYDC